MNVFNKVPELQNFRFRITRLKKSLNVLNAMHYKTSVYLLMKLIHVSKRQFIRKTSEVHFICP